jgi:two-component system NarL family sensor kinase
LNLLHTVGDLLSMAIERARLFEKSTQLGVIEERNRLAREIHDTLAQGLTGIILQLESVDAMLEAGVEPARVRQTVQHGLTLARANLDEVRRSVLDLRAAPLEGRNLAEALANLAETYTAGNILPVQLTVTGSSQPLPVRIEVGLYRIVQECLTNITRHAEASRAKIGLSISPNQVRLVIEDDGQGFDPAQVPPGHFGLIGLNERVKLLGGKLQLETNPGAGVRVEVVIPLNEAK